MDVGSYVDAANDIRRSVQGMQSEFRVEQLPILGVTKDAIVGLRYTLSDQRVSSKALETSSAPTN